LETGNGSHGSFRSPGRRLAATSPVSTRAPEDGATCEQAAYHGWSRRNSFAWALARTGGPYVTVDVGL